MRPMAGHTCYHCKQFVEEGEAHDCWTTTEGALLEEASEDLREAYQRLRDTAVELGDQRIYASHHCIMFSRKACYFFVRPKRAYLELCVFLSRTVTAPQIKKAMPSSKTKTAHLIHIRHRDEVEAPITDWLREAYGLQDVLAGKRKEKREKVVRASKARTSPMPTHEGHEGRKGTKKRKAN